MFVKENRDRKRNKKHKVFYKNSECQKYKVFLQKTLSSMLDKVMNMLGGGEIYFLKLFLVF